MRTRHHVHGLALVLVATLATPCYAADPAEAPSAFIAELAHNAFLSADSKMLSSGDRQQQFEGLLDKDFDVPRIASFVLGHYWQKASDAERQEFTAVFRDFMIRTYYPRFSEYSSASFKIIRQRAESATSTVVYTEISQPASDQPIKVEWRVADKGGYKITDMSVDGISMALAKREEFSSSLERNGGDLPGLIRQLQVKMSTQQSP